MSRVIDSEQIQVLIDRFEARGAAAEKAVALYEETVAPSVARCNWSNVGHVCREIDRLEHERKVWTRAVRELRDLLPTNPVLEATLDVEYGEAAAIDTATPKIRDTVHYADRAPRCSECGLNQPGPHRGTCSRSVMHGGDPGQLGRLVEDHALRRLERDARAYDDKYSDADPPVRPRETRGSE